MSRWNPDDARFCTFPGCGARHKSGGLCNGHAEQVRRGLTLQPLRPRGASPLVDFADRVEIVLRDSTGAEHGRAVVDVADRERVAGWRWWRSGSIVGSEVGVPTPRTGVVLGRHVSDCPADKFVSYADGNHANCRRSNLRIVDEAETFQAQSIRTNNTSGYRGVSWDANRGMWRATVKLNYRVVWRDYFATAEEAGQAAHDAREDLYSNHQTRAAK